MLGVNLVKHIVDKGLLDQDVQVQLIPEDGDELEIEVVEIQEIGYDDDNDVGVIKVVQPAA